MNFIRGMCNAVSNARIDFKVHMFHEDIERMKNWVLRHPDRETGGNLFGLWSDHGEPVIHIVLGPAEGCRRTEVSFYQDVPYLERVGRLLTNDYLLCHIGEWHSHHQLRLSEPSSGDSSTVIRNYPRGTCGFLLIIANIRRRERTQDFEVTLSPYLYTEGHTSYQKGEICELLYPSPFRAVSRISGEIKKGEEKERKENIMYMFEQDQAMMKEILRDNSGNEPTNGGDLFGLWTTAREPVIHLLLRPSDTQKEIIQMQEGKKGKKENDTQKEHLQNENTCQEDRDFEMTDLQEGRKAQDETVTQGLPHGGRTNQEEKLSRKYPSLQKIGRYALHSLHYPSQNGHLPTLVEIVDFCHAFPYAGVLIVAYPVTEAEDKMGEDIGLAAYIFEGDPNHYSEREILTIPGPKLFFEETAALNLKDEDQEKDGNGSEENLINLYTQPSERHSPNFNNHGTPV